jgi:hypothetical protein
MRSLILWRFHCRPRRSIAFDEVGCKTDAPDWRILCPPTAQAR